MTTQRDIRNQIAYARKEGVAQGIAEGEARGEAKGAETKAIEVAKNLKSLGIPLDKIAQATGLSEEKIQHI